MVALLRMTVTGTVPCSRAQSTEIGVFKRYRDFEADRCPHEKMPLHLRCGGQEPRPPQRFLEMHRLAYMVKTIDRAVAVVPKGALLVEASPRR